MRIMFITNYFYPEVGASSYLYQELAQSLKNLGHEVTIVTGFPRYNIQELDRKYRRKLWMREMVEGIEVLRIRTVTLPRYVPIARGLEYIGIGLSLFLRAVFSRRPDVALVYSPPIFLGLSAVGLRKLKKVPFILNVHDLFPQTAIDLGMLTNKKLISIFQKLEKYLYKSSNWVTTHSEQNKDWVVDHGGDPNRTSPFPIWMDSTKLTPGSRLNKWRSSQGLNDKFVPIFSGTQGFNQDIKVILKAAERLQEYSEIEFVIIGNGAQNSEMIDKTREMKLQNVRWLDWQPREDFKYVMHTADVVLATLKKEVLTPVVPSKIPSAMSAGRPVITTMNLQGDAPELVNTAESGITLEPGDDAALAEAILKMYNNRTLGENMGKKGRGYVEQYLDVSVWAGNYVELFSNLIKEKS